MRKQVINMTHYLTNKKSHDKNSPGQYNTHLICSLMYSAMAEMMIWTNSY